ncbi:MAG: acyl-CoA/acyl-ACP dehydrogenase [Proteobacteria bacterium]|nr:acyl-CoA/acyl-ACP dehydrogenase [Pseudomonadota bacterium]
MLDLLLTEEQKALREEVRDLVKWVPRQMILDMDREVIRFNKEFLREAGRRNLLGVHLPRKWGGRDQDWPTLCMVVEEIGTLGYAFGCLYGVGGCLVCFAIVEHGTDEQKAKYVKPLLAGDIYAAECLTEPRGGGGSDFFGTTTTAVDQGDHFLVNGQKRFIVGAEGADYFMVYARTSFDPDVPSHKALTCFLIDRGPGVEVEYIYGLMGLRGCGTGRLVFKDAKVPKENVLGEINGGKAIFDTIMIPERLGSAVMCIGPARTALEVATGYTSRRKAFGQTINNFQGVSFQVAEAATLLDAARAITLMAAQAAEKSSHPRQARRMISEAKRFSTEACMKVVNHAFQVMGGIGYTNVFPIERIYRDIRLGPIWTGSNEVMSMIVAHEWYTEYLSRKALGRDRDYEGDAAEAEAVDEKIYE